MMPIFGQRALDAARQGAPLLVFNQQKGWIPAGPGALARFEQAIREKAPAGHYAALVPHPVAIGSRGYGGYVPSTSFTPATENPRMAPRSISRYVHWTLERAGYVGIGQVTGDTYTITPVIDYELYGRFEFQLSLATFSDDPFRGGRWLGQSTHHKKLMLKADKREAKYAVDRTG